MDFVFDIALIVIVIISAFIGKKVGFVRSVLNLVKSIAAFILAKITSEYAAQFLFDNIISKEISKRTLSASLQ